MVQTAESDGRQADPDERDVREQLERILASADFGLPERGRNFLRYVVEETLTGRSDRIKAYAIAIEVFGRPENFDAQNDPVVRIEAGRLRRALERYYLTAGAADPVVIDIPKGGYVPRFQTAAPASDGEPGASASPAAIQDVRAGAAAAAPLPRLRVPIAAAVLAVACVAALALIASRSGWLSGETVAASRAVERDGPSLVIRPFADLGGGPDTGLYAAGLTEEVLFQVARFKELTVLGRETSRRLPADASVTDIGRDLGVHYVLEGAVRTGGDRMRVTARVLDGNTGAVTWSHAYESDLGSGDIIGIETDIASKVATAVGQPYGIIINPAKLDAAPGNQGNLDAYRCTLTFYEYRAVLSAETHARVRSCLEDVVRRDPRHATAWAMLAHVYVDETRFGINQRAGGPTAYQRAREAAHRATDLDPENTRALQALMIALFYDGEPAEALAIGEQAAAMNPNDTELLGQLGAILVQSGDLQRGAAYLENALTLNPGNAGYYSGVLAMASLMRRDYARAETLIRQADLQNFSMFHVIAALIYAQRGLMEEAARNRETFLTMRPDFFPNILDELAMRNFRPEDQTFLIDAARKAGFQVDIPASGNGVTSQ